MNISASELVKRSTSQLLFKTIRQLNWNATLRQVKGNKYADDIVAKEEGCSEKRGVIKLDNEALLFFCIDLVKDNKYIEIKMVDDMNDAPEWYLQSSIMQATFYASLLTKVKSLDTPKFRKKEGYKQEVILIKKSPIYELWFGEDKYRVYPNKKIYNHYIKKIKLLTSSIDNADYSACRAFDSKYKHNEFEIFNPKFESIN